MLAFALAWLTGDLLLQHLAKLPSLAGCVMAIGFISVITICIKWFEKPILLRSALWLCITTLSFTYANWQATQRLAWSIPTALQQQTVFARGQIINLPTHRFHQQTVLFHLQKWSFASETHSVNSNILLSFPETTRIHVGDEWQGLIRWKPVHGIASPGASDYAAWCLQENIRASATVVSSGLNQVLTHAAFTQWINQKRERIAEAFASIATQQALSPWLLALMIGERQGVPDADWDVLRLTGTNHLMAIAGLHIGMLSLFVYGFCNRLWRFVPRACLYFPAQQAGLIAASFAAIAYAAFAGFSLPTERAVIMLLVAFSARFLKQHLPAWHGFGLALSLVLILNPFVVLSDSFWLSFITIAAVTIGMQARIAPSGVWWRWGRVQWVIAIALLPVNLILFQTFSLIGVIANCIAIPWLCFTILPFCLLSLMTITTLPQLTALFLKCANASFLKLWWLLTYLSALPFASFTLNAANAWVVTASVVAIFFILLPRQTPGRFLALFGLLPLAFAPIVHLPLNTLRLNILDVGQGLAIVLETAQHALVFDAGPNLGMDAGARIVLPFLLKANIKRIDKLIISHGDNDHIGGANALLEQLPVKEIITSVPYRFKSASKCLANQAWEWDGVQFQFLYPTLNDLQRKNDSSCVLKISLGKRTILLTGDIEKYAEEALLQRASEQLSSDIIVAPHHGSKTSGLAEFISAVHPAIVVYATGFLNRYHFPHASVMGEYAAINAKQWNTATSGTISFLLNARSIDSVQSYRESHSHYWW